MSKYGNKHPPVLITWCMNFGYEKGNRAVKMVKTARSNVKMGNSVHLYGKVMKTRLKREESELTIKCSQLNLLSADGKLYNTDLQRVEKRNIPVFASRSTFNRLSIFGELFPLHKYFTNFILAVRLAMLFSLCYTYLKSTYNFLQHPYIDRAVAGSSYL